MKKAGLIKGSILLGSLLFSGSIKTAIDLQQVSFKKLGTEGKKLARSLVVKGKLNVGAIEKALFEVRKRLLGGLDLDVVTAAVELSPEMQRAIEVIVPKAIGLLERVLPFASKPASVAGLVSMVILPNDDIMKLFKPRFAVVLRDFVGLVTENRDLINNRVGPGLERFLTKLRDGLKMVDRVKGSLPELYKRTLINALGRPVIDSAVREVMQSGLLDFVRNNKDRILEVLTKLKGVNLREIRFPEVEAKIREIVRSKPEQRGY